MSLKLVSTLDFNNRAKLAEKYKDADKQASKHIIIFGILGLIIAETFNSWVNAWYAPMLSLLLNLLCIWVAINVLFLARWPAAIFSKDM